MHLIDNVIFVPFSGPSSPNSAPWRYGTADRPEMLEISAQRVATFSIRWRTLCFTVGNYIKPLAIEDSIQPQELDTQLCSKATIFQ